jgi:DNA-binding response OmpR family regulator
MVIPKVMFINANQVEAQYYAPQLKLWNLDVTFYSNLEEAIPHISLKYTDVIVLDSRCLNGEYGFAFIRKYSKIPMIILGETTSNHAEIQYLEAGADDFITKPYLLEILALKLKALVRRKNSASLPLAIQKDRNLPDVLIQYLNDRNTDGYYFGYLEGVPDECREKSPGR